MKFSLACTFLLLASISTAAYSKDTVTAVVPDVKPWGFIKDTKSSGIIGDFVRAIIEGAGYEMGDEKVYPFSRLLARLESGKSDLGAFARYLSQNNNKLVPIVELVDDAYIILYKKKNGRVYNDWQDFKDKSVGMIRGGKLLDEFDTDNKITRERVNNNRQLIRMLIHGHVDGVAELKRGLETELMVQGLNPDDYANVPLKKMTIWLTYSQVNYDQDMKNGTIEALKNSVEQLKKTDFFNNTFNRYTIKNIEE